MVGVSVFVNLPLHHIVHRPGYKKDQNCANYVYKHQNTFFVNMKYSRIAWDIDTSSILKKKKYYEELAHVLS